MKRITKEKLLPNLFICWQWINKNSAVLVLVLALTTVITAFVGLGHSPETPTIESKPFLTGFNRFTDQIYESAQAMLLNMEPHRTDFNAYIGIARLTAVLLVVLVATQAIGRLFKDSQANLRLRFGGKRNVFVGGLGRIGFQLATDFACQGKLVVAQEIGSADHWRQAAEDAGVIVVEGDVTDINSLREHIYRDPATIHLVTGNDLANINALANVRSLRREYLERTGKPLGTTDCYVHIDDPGLQRTLNRCLIESTASSDESLNIHVFNIYHETACQLIIDQLTPLRPRERNEVALYIVFGFEQMGKAMVKELAEYAHFENQKRSRILVLTPAAIAACEQCLAQWSRLSPYYVHSELSEVAFNPQSDEWTSQLARPRITQKTPVASQAVEYAANVHFCEMIHTDSLSLRDVQQIVRLVTEAGVRAVALFCFEDDETNFRLASELNDALQDFHGINRSFEPEREMPDAKKTPQRRTQELHLPIYTFLPHSRPLREILSESTEKYPLKVFGGVHEGLSRAHDSAIEQIAMDIACSYDFWQNGIRPKLPESRDSTKSRTELESLQLLRAQYTNHWRSKSYWEQHSNLTAAEHAWIKVQMLGFRMANATQARNPSAPQACNLQAIPKKKKALLALVEHNRWMAERLLLGWSYGERMDHPPQRESICSKQHLPADELVKDFQQIEAVIDHFLKRKFVLLETQQIPN